MRDYAHDPVVSAVRRRTRTELGLAFVPEVVRELERHMPVKAAHRALRELAEVGILELRPEGGLGRLTPEEVRLSLVGPQKVPLTWVRIVRTTVAEGAAERADVAYESGGFLQLYRDRVAIARAIDDLEESSPGALHPIARVRSKVDVPKDRFDLAMLDMQADRTVTLHFHDYPSSLPKAKLAELVHDKKKDSDKENWPQGLYYVGVAPARESTAKDCDRSHPPEVPTTPCDPEPSGARDAGPFATVQRDPHELARGKALGSLANARAVYDLLRDQLSRESQEVYLVILLDIYSELVGRPAEVARGQRDEVRLSMSDILRPVIASDAAAFISDILRPVIASNAAAFIVVHNHPSAHARPSPQDKKLTDDIRRAAATALPDVAFLDHVIVGATARGGEFYSFEEKDERTGRKGKLFYVHKG